jgi:hypothetical protein
MRNETATVSQSRNQNTQGQNLNRSKPNVKVYMLDGRLIAVYSKSKNWLRDEMQARYYDEDGKFGAIATAELERWKYMAELIDLPQRPVSQRVCKQVEEMPYVIQLLWGIKTRKELVRALVHHRCGKCEGCRNTDNVNSFCSDRDLLKSVASEHGFKGIGVRKPLRPLARS